MNPLCQTCTNIFDYPKCCTENLTDCVKVLTHCGNYSAGNRKDVSEIHFNPQTVKIFDEDCKPHYEFGGYEPSMAENYTYQIHEQILAQVVNVKEKACIQAIYKWAQENEIEEVLLCDEDELREVLNLGFAEYNKVHKQD